MMKRTFIPAILALMAFSANAETIRFATRPSLSPDGATIYFAYDGDIFSVPAKGGNAVSIVNIGGNENAPIVSPDGKYLAFSSDIMGNQDVYVVPVGGGDVKQLTFNDASDTPASWSADSKYIYFESTRGSARKTTYKVAVSGGTPELLFDGWFNTIVNVSENPKTGEFLFNESMESISFPTRKRYVGEHNPNIKSWNPKSKKYQELTDYEGKDQWPMADRNGNIYYVSDAYNKESNLVKYDKSGPVQLTTFDKSIQYPQTAFNGSAIVFLKEYQINVLDLASGKVSVPEITLSANAVDVHRQFADQKPSAADVSPDGKKFALVIRGQLYISDTKCKFLQKLDTPSNERVSEVIWGKDNKTVYYTRTNKGWTDVFSIAADMSSAETPVYMSANNSKSLRKSNKGDKFAFIDGSRNVMLYDMEKKAVEKIAEAEFWSFQNYDIAFSADDSYMAFDAMNMFESDIFVYSFKDKKLTNLTNSASTDEGMVFSPDGKYMFLLSNPTATSFPRGNRSSLYKLSLQKYDKPFKSDEYDKLFVEEPAKDKKDAPQADAKDAKGKKAAKAESKEVKKEEKKEAKKDSSLVIDFKDVYRRMEPVERGGSQSSLYVFSSKAKDLLLYGSYGDNGRGVYALDLRDPEAKPKAVKMGDGPAMGGRFFRSENDLYALSGGAIYKIDPNSLNGTKVNVSLNVDKLLSDEFEQMFYETWAVLEQNYYDVNFHGADWFGVRDYYASLVPYVRTRDNLRTLLTDMLGELNSSHLGFSSTGNEETYATRVSTMNTGIMFSETSPYKVDRILADSPADKVSIDLKKGDELVAVNGKRIDPKENREMYFSSPVKNDELKLTFKRGGKEHDVKVHTCTTSEIKALLYREWETQRKDIVESKSKGRIAYHHMQAMGDTDLNDFLLAMHTDAVHKDALILDLRYNNGGNVHKEVIDFLRQEEHFQWSYRDFPTTTHPNVVPAGKPIVVLVNEHSLSDAEVTSNGIKTLGIAKLIGTETYRWIIFTSSVRLIDGSTCRMPAWGCYNVNGQDLEHIGVKPDIYVKNTFKDRISGDDPQLDAAIEEVLKQLK